MGGGWGGVGWGWGGVGGSGMVWQCVVICHVLALVWHAGIPVLFCSSVIVMACLCHVYHSLG